MYYNERVESSFFMKRILIFILLLFLPTPILAIDKMEASFSRCIDGDTAELIIEEREVKIRLLAVDTPETKHPKKGEEPFGKEASNYTCEALKKAEKIEVKYDQNADKKDKYERNLVWVFVDDELLQEQLVELGYAKVAYLYGEYEYTPLLKEKEELAKSSGLGIWGEEPNDLNDEIIIIIVLIIFLIVFLFSQTYRKKVIKKAKRNVKKKMKNILK